MRISIKIYKICNLCYMYLTSGVQDEYRTRCFARAVADRIGIVATPMLKAR
ncbi:hypothetical protein [Chamaesiphon sp.]|uniref:hypothetical protein n=1 Tax=Chamaesiphon sp. TaxID=2814140 RepID=UPI003593C9DC